MGFKKPSTTVTSYVDKPGWFHLAVVRVEENPVIQNEQKDRVDIHVAVLDGTEPTQKKREMTISLNNPNEGHQDGGEFAAKVQCRAAVAMDIPAIITDTAGERAYCEIQKVPEGADMEIDFLGHEHRNDPENVAPWVIGKQFVAKVKEDEYTNRSGTKVKTFKLDGAHLYHVTDPDVAHVPMSAESLKLGGYKVTKPASSNGANGEAKAEGKAPTKGKGGAAGAKSTVPAGGATSPASKPAAGGAPAKPATAAAGAYDDL